jgi:tRNA1(Val) A37 N6-methylase TrmN6
VRMIAEAKMGFYPVANEALALLTRAFRVEGDTALLDPCAGEGAAVKFWGEALGIPQARTYAIELAENRADRLAENLPDAKSLAPCSFLSSHVTPNSLGLVWCNPPFQDEIGGGKRVEYSFLARATPLLVKGGVMCFMMPHRALGYDIVRYFNQHFEQARRVELPEDWRHYDEILLIGKRRNDPIEDYDGVDAAELETLPDGFWSIPKAPGPAVFKKSGPTPAELERLLERSPLSRVFDPPQAKLAGRPPLPLGKGHLALLLASGQLNGLVPSDPPHVVRGTSRKEEFVSENKVEENEQTGATTQTIVKREKVVLVVRTVDQTGEIMTLEGG